MSSGSKFLGSMLWNQLGRFGEIGLSLLFTVLIVRWLSQAEFSTYSTLINLVTLAGFVISLGLSDGLLRYIPRIQKVPSPAPLWLLQRFFLIRLVIFLVAAGLLWLGRDWLSTLLGQPFIRSEVGLLLLLLLSMNLVDLLTAFFTAMFWTREIVLIRLAGQFLNILILLIWAWFLPLSQSLLLLSVTFNNVFILLVSLAILRKRGLLRTRTVERIDGDLKGVYSYSRDLWLINLVTLGLMGQVDIILLSALASDVRAVAFYSVATLLLNRIYSLVVAWSGSLTSITATVLLEKGLAGLERYFTYYYRLNLLLHLIPVVALASVAAPLSTFLFGTNYRGIAELVIVLVMQHVAAALLGHTICAAFINSLGRQKVILIWRCILSGLNIVLDVLLIPLFGAMGAVLATSGCNLLLYIVEFVVLRKLFSKLSLNYTLKITAVVISGGLLASLIGEVGSDWMVILLRGFFYLAYLGGFFLLIKPISETDKQLISSFRPGFARFTRFFSR